jgi:hypothetical protein
MIESNIIKWLDFGDTTQKMEIYAKEKTLRIFRFFRALTQNRFPNAIEVTLIIMYFLRLLAVTSYFASYDNDIIPNIFYYLKKILLLSDIITDKNTFVNLFYIVLLIIIFDLLFMFIIFITLDKIKLIPIIYLVNLVNIIIYYYLSGPAIGISIISFWYS